MSKERAVSSPARCSSQRPSKRPVSAPSFAGWRRRTREIQSFAFVMIVSV